VASLLWSRRHENTALPGRCLCGPGVCRQSGGCLCAAGLAARLPAAGHCAGEQPFRNGFPGAGGDGLAAALVHAEGGGGPLRPCDAGFRPCRVRASSAPGAAGGVRDAERAADCHSQRPRAEHGPAGESAQGGAAAARPRRRAWGGARGGARGAIPVRCGIRRRAVRPGVAPRFPPACGARRQAHRCNGAGRRSGLRVALLRAGRGDRRGSRHRLRALRAGALLGGPARQNGVGGAAGVGARRAFGLHPAGRPGRGRRRAFRRSLGLAPIETPAPTCCSSRRSKGS